MGGRGGGKGGWGKGGGASCILLQTRITAHVGCNDVHASVGRFVPSPGLAQGPRGRPSSVLSCVHFTAGAGV